MIELVFVIVVIGILAAVALPKLAATRDDARVSEVLANTKQLLSDVRAYFESKGNANYIIAKPPQITNVSLYLNNTCNTRALNQRNFVGSTLYLCIEGNAVLKVTTTNSGTAQQTITLKEIRSSTVLSNMLHANPQFQKFTNGTSGKTYKINGSKVSF